MISMDSVIAKIMVSFKTFIKLSTALRVYSNKCIKNLRFTRALEKLSSNYILNDFLICFYVRNTRKNL